MKGLEDWGVTNENQIGYAMLNVPRPFMSD